MYADLNVLVVILAAVLAVSIVCHIVVLRRISKLSAAQRNHDIRDTVELRAAIAQMLDEVIQLSAAVDRKLSQSVQTAQPHQPLQPAQPLQAVRPAVSAGVYGLNGVQKEKSDARPVSQAPSHAAAPAATLEALLEASDRVVDKLELARKAGIGVGEVELWLRRQEKESRLASQTRVKAGV
ncbi:MAG: hypothetical protein EPO21_15600 [Chloroflexota bacterium]|nr:MAG: hypothetical protein EPO21_15600 [Chloroflexota bacterium]